MTPDFLTNFDNLYWHFVMELGLTADEFYELTANEIQTQIMIEIFEKNGFIKPAA